MFDCDTFMEILIAFKHPFIACTAKNLLLIGTPPETLLMVLLLVVVVVVVVLGLVLLSYELLLLTGATDLLVLYLLSRRSTKVMNK